ncbi:MAG: hypothetical protein U0172_09960 [Nitrospiraceae bacterium]
MSFSPARRPIRPGPFPAARPAGAPRPGGNPAAAQGAEHYGSFQASLLYCGRCRQATPTRQRLLLVLPTGNLYEYLCAHCGTSTGSKTEKDQPDISLIRP